MDGWGGRSQLRQRAASSAKVAEAQDRCALVIDNGGCQHAVEAVDVLQAAGGGLFGGEEPAVERATELDQLGRVLRGAIDADVISVVDRGLGGQAAAGSDNEVYVSAASAREIAIQVALDRLRAPADLAGFFAEEMRRSAFVPLGIHIGHGLAVRTLPDHHRDPFDRWWVFSERCARVLPQEARASAPGRPAAHASAGDQRRWARCTGQAGHGRPEVAHHGDIGPGVIHRAQPTI